MATLTPTIEGADFDLREALDEARGLLRDARQFIPDEIGLTMLRGVIDDVLSESPRTPTRRLSESRPNGGQIRDCDAPRFARLYLLALGELERLIDLSNDDGSEGKIGARIAAKSTRVVAICRRFEP